MPILGRKGVSGPPDRAIMLSQTGEPLAACLEDCRGALSDHTVRALRTDLDAFASWCAERNLSPLPARADTVAAYIDAMADARAPATVRRYVVQHRHGPQGGRGAEPARGPLGAAGAPADAAAQWVPAEAGARPDLAASGRLIRAAGDRVIDLRNRALLAVAYDAMLRRSEMVALQVVDMTMDRSGSASLLVRRAKNDPGGGRGHALPPPRHRQAGARVARRERDRLGPAVPFGPQGRCRGRVARPGPRCPASSVRWPSARACLRTWFGGSRGTARAWARPRT